GFVWLLLWLAVYRNPESNPRVSSDELAHIRSDPPDPENARIPWIRLLGFRQTWAVAAGKLLADPIWWFYLYWLPKFLDARYGIRLAQVAVPLIVVYVVADVGSIGGGWLSGALIKRGWTVNRARKTAMLAMALLIVPTALAPLAGSMWTAVLIVGVAAAAHQAWSANVYTLASDMFPRAAVGSVVGIGAFAGGISGWAFQPATGLGVAGAALTPSFSLSRLWRGGQGVRPEPLRLGVASYSLRNFPREKAIEMVKALGTPYINLKSMHLPYELSRDEVAAARRE